MDNTFLTLVFVSIVISGVVSSSLIATSTTDSASVEENGVFTSCDLGWILFGEKCYRIGEGVMNWHNASKTCAQYGGQFVSIHSDALTDFIFTFLLLNEGSSAWIGLHDTEQESVFVWDDGSSLDYTNWETREPSRTNTEGNEEDCVEMFYISYRSNTGTWNDKDCSRKLPFICQKDKGKEDKKNPDPRFCSPEKGGGWLYDKSCFNLVEKKKSWEEAENYCNQKYRGHLAAVNRATVNYFFKYVYKNVTGGTWIGMKLQGDVQKWVSGPYAVFTNWERSFSRYGNSGRCAERLTGGKWRPTTCDTPLYFICEESLDTPPVLKPPVLAGSHCPKEKYGGFEWKDIGGEYCYYFEFRNGDTWIKANFKCMRLGGALASIHSEEEQLMLNHYIKHTHPVSKIYIGLLRDYNKEFFWVDRSPVDYVAWDVLEPNSEDEHCSEMLLEKRDSMNWNDVNCEERKPFVCSTVKLPPSSAEENDTENSTSASINIITVEGISKNKMVSAAPSRNRTSRKYSQEKIQTSEFPTTTVAVVLSVLFVAVLFGAVVYYFRPWGKNKNEAPGKDDTRVSFARLQ